MSIKFHSLQIYRKSLSCQLAVNFLLCSLSFAIDHLPVFIADNHASSLAWLAEKIELDEPHALVLVDAHSDASCVENSDVLRDALRRVSYISQRNDIIEKYRRAGKVQAYNWLEPLLPRPIDHVTWLPAMQFDEKTKAEKIHEATSQIDNHLEYELRASQSLASRWHILSADDWLKQATEKKPTIVSIDLDFFTGIDSEQQKILLEKIWIKVLSMPELKAVTFAISRPWLRDDAEAKHLLFCTLEMLHHTPQADWQISQALDDYPDHSQQAEKLRAAGKKLSYWQPKQLSEEPIASLLQPTSHLQLENTEADTDGVYRVKKLQNIHLINPPPNATGKCKWYQLIPASSAYDFLPHTGLGKNFSNSASRYVYWQKKFITETTDFSLSAEKLSPLFDATYHCGSIKIVASYQTENHWLTTPTTEICLLNGTGFHAGLSESFGLPYTFGIALENLHAQGGVDTRLGSDCSNFLIHAWRQNGFALPWSNPALLRTNLSTIKENCDATSSIPISENQIQAGIMLDFGEHVAALWQDVAPLGILTGDDLAAHHLGSFPEVVPIKKLCEKRPHFSIRTKPNNSSITIRFTGDVTPLRYSSDTFSWLQTHLSGSDFSFINLEGCPLAVLGKSTGKYDFRFPASELSQLKKLPITAVSLANNHQADAGNEFLTKTFSLLSDAKISYFGAGDFSYTPQRHEKNGVAFSIFGFSDLSSSSQSLEKICAAITQEKNQHRVVIVMLHSGQEYEKNISSTTQHTVRELIQAGANIIVGSHPHIVQRSDFYHGSYIAYSLGNALFPQELNQLATGALLEIRFDAKGNVLEQKMITIQGVGGTHHPLSETSR